MIIVSNGRIDPAALAAATAAQAATLPRSRQPDPREVASWPYADRMAYEAARRRNVAARGHELAGAAPLHGMGYPSEISGADGSSGWGWAGEISGADYWLGGETQQAGYSPSPMYPHVHHGMSRHPRGHGFAPGAGASLEETREGVAGLAPGYMAMISPTVSMTPPGSAPIPSTAPASPAPTPWYEPAVMLWGEFVDWAKGIL